jgi:hypothetical protein
MLPNVKHPDYKSIFFGIHHRQKSKMPEIRDLIIIYLLLRLIPLISSYFKINGMFIYEK